MATGYGHYDCVVCGTKGAMVESAETNQPFRTCNCSECGYTEEHCQESTMIGFVRGNDERLNPAMFRKVAELMDEELSKAQKPDKDAPSPNTDGVNVVRFASDLPSGEKWEACKEFIKGLDEEHLLQQAGSVLEALHLEDIASYWCLGDYKARIRLNDIVAELECRLGRQRIKQHCAEMLAKHEREIDLYEKHDLDGLLKGGFVVGEDYETLRRLWSMEMAKCQDGGVEAVRE